MSRRFTGLGLLLVLLLSSEVGAIGLGDIKLNSALNEPLSAEIVLLSATPDEIDDLKVSLASAETFARYGIDRPFFLQSVEFSIVNGGVAGSIVQVRSRAPITEPFLTFLVEANWPSGRLLREYTVLLDPPTYAPPEVQQAPAVAAPVRSTPADSGRIERPPAQPDAAPPQQTPPQAAPQPPQPARSAEPKPQPPAADIPYDTAGGGDYLVERNETLWGIASRLRPDSRLTMNQTMLAIYEANPEAFGGNINLLKAGASLRIPSADDVFRISRGDALSEVTRQHNAWAGGDAAYSAPDTTSGPSLTLVPPDEEPVDTDYVDDTTSTEPYSREDEILDRISALEVTDMPDQQSLIEIRDSELAALRQELANLRGEVYEPPVVEPPVEEPVEGPFVEDADPIIDDIIPDTDEPPAEVVDDTTVEPVEAVVEAPAQDSFIRSQPSSDKSIVGQAIEFATGIWGIIIGALILVVAALTWFMTRGDDEDSGPWEELDSEDIAVATTTMAASESRQAPSLDDAFVVVEQDTGPPAAMEEPVGVATVVVEDSDLTKEFASPEDTFSSETAINLDQTDPVAEADFHMAYGLYDQAADLINGALESDPADRGLMSKLCEIYFVWGNRDAFVDAATRLKAAVGAGSTPEWDKIVIMGQQIAADHGMFAGAAVGGATEVVDLSFDDAGQDSGGLDMDFGAADSGADVIDMGAGDADDSVDFLLDQTGSTHAVDMSLDVTAENPTLESELFDLAAETSTSELPSLEDTLGQVPTDIDFGEDATAEMNLDELDLDIDGLAVTEVASFDDLNATGQIEGLSDTGINEALADSTGGTGKNPEIDPSSTGVRAAMEMESFEDLDATGEMRLATDETGRSPMIDLAEEAGPTDVAVDDSLLNATGHTQILSDDLAVETGADVMAGLSDSEATVLAPLDEDFDFAKTEALPADTFAEGFDTDETQASPAIAEMDVDLDLDDLTAALQLSDAGDNTVEQLRDDATVEQPRPGMPDETAQVETMSLAPEDMSDDLHDARTMTEVGTKLDLARAYVDMGDPAGARSILEEVLDEGDESQKQQAQQLLDSLPG